MAKGKVSFEEQKARFKALANSAKKIIKNGNIDFLDSIKDELKVYIEKGVSFPKIAKNIEDVFKKKISVFTLKKYCIDTEIHKPRPRKKNK